MDHITNLYKNKAQQLQEQLTILENKLKALSEDWGGAPGYAYAPGNKNAPYQSDSQLEDRARDIKSSGPNQSQEYRDIQDELARRRGGSSTGQSSGGSSSKARVELSADTPDWVKRIGDKYGQQEAEETEAMRLGVTASLRGDPTRPMDYSLSPRQVGEMGVQVAKQKKKVASFISYMRRKAPQ